MVENPSVHPPESNGTVTVDRKTLIQLLLEFERQCSFNEWAMLELQVQLETLYRRMSYGQAEECHFQSAKAQLLDLLLSEEEQKALLTDERLNQWLAEFQADLERR